MKKTNENLLLVAVYVDDLFVTGTSVGLINQFKAEMSSQFEMSDLGKLTYYLGIEVIQHDEGITLNQRNYAMRILEDAGMKDCNPTQTPMDSNLKLTRASEEEEIECYKL